MEIHHRTQDVSNHKGKKWTHYFWEFFMLFLAVTLGFFVENQREHYVEQGREKDYAQSLYNDLKLDTSRMNIIRNIKQWRGAKLDSLKMTLSQDDLQHYSRLIYYYSLILYMSPKFYTQDATIQQLRSSGSLRYFKNQQLYDSIVQYYALCKFYFERESENDNLVAFPSELMSSLFDSKLLMANLSATNYIKGNIRMPEGNPALLTTDKKVINSFYLFVANKKWVNDVSLVFLASMELNVKNLMIKLKDGYHLE